MNIETEQLENRLLEKTRFGKIVWERAPDKVMPLPAVGGKYPPTITVSEFFSSTIGDFSLRISLSENTSYVDLEIKHENHETIVLQGNRKTPRQSLKALFNFLKNDIDSVYELQKQKGQTAQQNTIDELTQQLA